MRFAVVVVFFAVVGAPVVAQPKPPDTHAQHTADVKKHGAEAMGFDQDKTTHHFRLHHDGGAVEVQAKEPMRPASGRSATT